jgi:hypothetical protein
METGKSGIKKTVEKSKFIILTPLILKVFFFINGPNFNQNINIQNDINIHAIDVLNLAGEKEKIFLGDPQEITLMFIFNNSCGLCENNIVIWNRLFTQVSKQTNIIGLCFYNLKEANFVKEARDIRFPIYIVSNNTKNIIKLIEKKVQYNFIFW